MLSLSTEALKGTYTRITHLFSPTSNNIGGVWFFESKGRRDQGEDWGAGYHSKQLYSLMQAFYVDIETFSGCVNGGHVIPSPSN